MQELGGLAFPCQACQLIQFNNGSTVKGLEVQVNTATIAGRFPTTSNEITHLQKVVCQRGMAPQGQQVVPAERGVQRAQRRTSRT
jgi:hypothetical protein